MNGVFKEPDHDALEVGVHLATFSRPSEDERVLRRLLSGLQEFAPEYVPDSFYVGLLDGKYRLRKAQKRPLTLNTISELRESIHTSTPGYAVLVRGTPPIVSIRLWTPFESQVSYELVSLSVRREIVGTPKARQQLIKVAQHLFGIFRCFFCDLGTVHLVLTEPDANFVGTHVVPTNLERGLPPPRWGFLLGPDYVTLLGAERLKLAPCEVARDFPDGQFLLLLAENFEVLEQDRSLWNERRQSLVQYLGPEYFSFVDAGSQRKVLPRFAPNR